ncbi:hypothetical protein ABIB25_000890 [Nakamurella sp. UYEF19]|uniref:hypothetical protein n=1 Tax=Nakamurella sp. UYEF19 TaxID=1756392 RepID=UPI0033965652
MSWQNVLNGIDAVESWLSGVSYWIQVPVLLLVLLPAVWALAGLVDRVVEKLLWPHTRREMRLAAADAIARHDAIVRDGVPVPETLAPEIREHARGSAG